MDGREVIENYKPAILCYNWSLNKFKDQKNEIDFSIRTFYSTTFLKHLTVKTIFLQTKIQISNKKENNTEKSDNVTTLRTFTQ